MVNWTVEVKADEFGIYDGRLIAQELIVEAIRLLLPYVDGNPALASRMMRTLTLGAATILEREINENKAQHWGVHFDNEIVAGDVQQAMKKHVEATKDLTTALLEKATADFKLDKH